MLNRQRQVLEDFTVRGAGRAAVVIAYLVMALGAIVFLGWMLDWPQVRSLLPGAPTMKANTALCFLLSGATLLTARARTAPPHGWLGPLNTALSLTIIVLAGASGAQYALGPMGLDELLVDDPSRIAFPGRMSVITAACFVLFGIATLWTGPHRSARLRSVLATIGLLLAALALVAHAYRARLVIDPLLASTTIAIHTAGGLVLLFTGLLLLYRDSGWLSTFFLDSGSGLVSRRTLPGLILIPLVLGWVGLAGMEAGLYGARGLMAWYAVLSVAALIAFLVLTARQSHRLERTMREREKIHSHVVRTSLNAFVLMDAKGRILDWNAQAEEIFGWSYDEVIGATVAEVLIPEPLRSAHRAGLARYVATGQGSMIGRRVEQMAIRRDGTEFPIELMIVPIRFDGKLQCSAFLRDLSEQRMIEQQLRQAQKMEALGRLTGGVAHDFNNLLTVMMGNLELVIMRDGSSTELEQALGAAERAAALVHRMLAFARQQQLEPQQLDVNELVTEMYELIQRAIGDDVEAQLTLSEGLWPVYADPGLVENALLNLAVNARDAMPGGGTLTIETENMPLDQDYADRNAEVEPGDYVMLAVSDTGIGMSPDVLMQAMDPFFTTKEKGKGTGLGLSMIYGSAKQSGGHLKIYSEPGEGTTVRLYLPRHRPAGDETEAAPEADLIRTGNGETILVVEDQDSVRDFVTLSLRHLGYRVIEATDGPSALATLAEHPEVDLLFTDVVMPGGLNGFELAESARASHSGLRVVLTSGYTEHAMLHQGRLTADMTFLAKPYKRAELARKVRLALDGD